jgi:hypothetical protein
MQANGFLKPQVVENIFLAYLFFLNQGTKALVLSWYFLNASPLERRDCSSVAGMPVTFSNRYKIIAGLMIAK